MGKRHNLPETGVNITNSIIENEEVAVIQRDETTRKGKSSGHKKSNQQRGL